MSSSSPTTATAPTKANDKSAAVPPKVITVDTHNDDDDERGDVPTDDQENGNRVAAAAANAQTPKHANKKDDNASASASGTPRLSIGSGSAAAFQPRDPRASAAAAAYYGQQQQQQQQQQQPPPPPQHQRYYDGNGYSEYEPQPSYRYAMYPPPMQPHYEQGPSWGVGGPYGVHPAAYGGEGGYSNSSNNTNNNNRGHNSNNNNPHFSRAVSSSFDRSVKSQMPSSPVADDASWGALNQVTSVDEDELMRKRKQRPTSTSSSITNSPGAKKDSHDHHQHHHHHHHSSSNANANNSSNSSNNKQQQERPDSPNSTASLDILKCPSGSSALLLPNPQRDMSQLSFNSKEEARQDKDTVDHPPHKKKKGSPLSITCSPPGSPKHQRSQSMPKQPLHPQPVYAKPVGVESGYRPSSPTSSVEQPSVQQMPSWELYGQDSFGAGSQLQGALSFGGADYLALSASASHEEGRLPPPPPPPPPHVMQGNSNGMPPSSALESRNQSFDQHQYFHRSDSMGYDGGRQGFEPPRGPPAPGYQGHYPVQPAPSWGSASSYPQHPGVYYPPPPNINRTGSYDNRFQPPPEFRAPPSMVKTQSTPSATIVSNYGRKKADTPFSWTKDEDNRLTEIMKKYKNPRDWDPIAKELNAGRSAKECHERWIRYLKPGVRKGQWTDHEDAIVMEAVSSSAEQPFTRWSDLAQRLPGRVGKQIRDRWVNHLNPNINHLPFSREDDLLLWEGHKKLGKRWVEISTKYFQSSRSENHIKNRWYSASFKKFISNEFGSGAYSGIKSPRKSKKAGV